MACILANYLKRDDVVKHVLSFVVDEFVNAHETQISKILDDVEEWNYYLDEDPTYYSRCIQQARLSLFLYQRDIIEYTGDTNYSILVRFADREMP
jgi:hypothetical protein